MGGSSSCAGRQALQDPEGAPGVARPGKGTGVSGGKGRVLRLFLVEQAGGVARLGDVGAEQE